MKQLKTILVIGMILTLFLVACGGEEAEPEVEVTPVETTGEVAQPAEEEGLAPTPTLLPPPVVEEVGEEGGEAAGETEAPAEEGEAAAPAPAEPAADAPVFPWPADRFGYGVQIHGNATVGDPIQTMDAIDSQLGMQWVKVQLKWPTVHPGPDVDQWFFYDGVVDEAYNHGLNLMLSVVGAPEWTRAAGGENGPPDDYSQFTAFLEELLTRYDGKVQAIEVWNEQNLDREWSTANGISPEDYVSFLELAYNTIKAHDPNIIVISGALAPTGEGDWVRWADDFAWLDRALAAGMLDYTDCVGAHHNGYNIPPDVAFDQTGSFAEAGSATFRGPFDNPHHSWSFQTTLNTYAEKVQAIDPEMDLCVTEFGWASSEGLEQVKEGFEFANDVTLQEQADYIVQAFEQMHDSGDVWLAFLHNFDFGNKVEPSHETVLYSLVDAQGIPRPAYGALSEMEKAP